MAVLPARLKKEPLIDAVFEIRFTSNVKASSVLPGFLFSKLDGDKVVNDLPTSDIPQQIRQVDPNLKFAPLVRLRWDDFFVFIGDFSVGVGCKIPYPGWASFKEAIIHIVRIVGEIGIIQSVQRSSLKYMDLIPSSDVGEQVSMILGSVVIGDHTLKKENFSLKIEIPENQFIHIVNIISSARAKLQDGSESEGIIIDIDTVDNMRDHEFHVWMEKLSENLETIHTVNKKMFFKCLRQETITALEPIYE